VTRRCTRYASVVYVCLVEAPAHQTVFFYGHKNQVGTTNSTPSIDHDGVMRVGGRLRHLLISYDYKHLQFWQKDRFLSYCYVIGGTC